jgi:hypothetical protein
LYVGSHLRLPPPVPGEVGLSKKGRQR